MTSVRGRGQPIRRSQASEAPIGPLLSNGDHEDPLGSNKPGFSEALASSEAPTGTPEARPGPPQAPPLPVPQDPDANRYSQQDPDRIIQTFLHVSKGGSGDKLKAKTPDVYCGRSHMECYTFCQQCKDHFATCGATGPYQILFAASFLWDWINFHWQQYKRKLEAESSVPISWDEFKTFLRKVLGDFRAFVDSYWTKIKRDSQYQQEEVLDWAAHLEHLQVVLKEFDPTGAPNETTLIRYFREGLRPSIRAQLDHRGRDLDGWEEVVEKAGDVEAKANLQPPFYIRDIDARCPKSYCPSAKKDKEDTYREPQNEASKDKDKAKPHSSSTSANQPQIQAPKKDKRGRRGGHPATGVNATEVAKKDKALKDLSHIEYYTCHQKGYYATKCPNNPKN